MARSNLPAENLVSNLNGIIYDVTTDDRYATFFYGIYDPDDHKFTYCNGGHNPPVLLRKDGKIELLKAEKLLIELENLAEKLGLDVRYEHGDFQGDYCIVKEDGKIIIQKKANLDRKIAVLSYRGVESLSIRISV